MNAPVFHDLVTSQEKILPYPILMLDKKAS